MPPGQTDIPAPQLSLRVEPRDGGMVIVCSGWLTAEFTGKFKGEIKRLIPAAKKIVLDLAPLTYMDSSGIGALAALYVSARTAGCQLRVVNLNRHVRELLKMTRLLAVFEGTSPAAVRLP